MTDRRSSAFAWYELVTSDAAAARKFYGHVIGWQSQNATDAGFPYTVFSSGETEVGGLMQLPPDALRKGAVPRWVGYVAVDDVDGAVERLRRLGGAVFVPPTDSNIGRVSIVADPQTADFGIVGGLKRGKDAIGPAAPGQVGWHELFAADGKRAFDFYNELFGWQAAPGEKELLESYRLVAAGGRTMAGIFTKLPRSPVFWMYYFEVADMAIAAARVKEGGGRVMQGPMEMPGGTWIARCMDPQGAMFSLEGKSSQCGIAPADELTWAADWGGFTSRGKVVAKPKQP